MMWWLLTLAAAHPSPHDFLSGNDAPAHAVCESYINSLFVAPANDNNSLSIKPAHLEVTTLRLDHIDTNTTPPSWLTSIPHTSQAKLVLAKHGVERSKLPYVMISSFWKNSTGAATGGLHPVEGDSALANLAATTESTPSSSRVSSCRTPCRAYRPPLAHHPRVTLRVPLRAAFSQGDISEFVAKTSPKPL